MSRFISRKLSVNRIFTCETGFLSQNLLGTWSHAPYSIWKINPGRPEDLAGREGDNRTMWIVWFVPQMQDIKMENAPEYSEQGNILISSLACSHFSLHHFVYIHSKGSQEIVPNM